jgi:hypothetical protein
LGIKVLKSLYHSVDGAKDSKRVDRISFKAFGYVISASVLAILGLITHFLGWVTYSETLVINIMAMTAGLYIGTSIVVGRGLERFLTALLISFLSIVISDVFFAFIQPFIAFSFSLVLLLVIVRYFLIRDHDSGWFGAVCAELMAGIFLFLIYVILAMVRAFLIILST